MGGTTGSQGLRFPYVDDVITDAAQANLGADIAAALSTQDTNRAKVLTRPFVYVRRGTTGQTFSDGVDTTVSFDLVNVDGYSMVNLGTQPTRITPGAGWTGMWKVSFSHAGSSSANKVRLAVSVTGTLKLGRSWASGANSPTTHSLSGDIYVANTTDYLEFKVLRNGSSGSDTVSVMAWYIGP